MKLKPYHTEDAYCILACEQIIMYFSVSEPAPTIVSFNYRWSRYKEIANLSEDEDMKEEDVVKALDDETVLRGL